MNDGVDRVVGKKLANEALVADIANSQTRGAGNCPAKACRQIVKDDNVLARAKQLENHLAADIARSAGH